MEFIGMFTPLYFQYGCTLRLQTKCGLSVTLRPVFLLNVSINLVFVVLLDEVKGNWTKPKQLQECNNVVCRSRDYTFIFFSSHRRRFLFGSGIGLERRRTRVMRGDNYTLLEAAALIRRCKVRRATGPLLRKCLPLALRARGEKKEKGIFILPGCEAPPSPVMVSAPREKCCCPLMMARMWAKRWRGKHKKATRAPSGGMFLRRHHRCSCCSVMAAFLHNVA